ncbi:MAG TPA: homogentisate 1,2-dioxygenase, partial [Rhodospirillales bacterium]|nr:homogentisate 1,2-dioxygenase [Rhodospirillales bacterium]
MRFNYAKGIHSRQAHANLPEGTYEEELGRDGFFGDQVQFYRLNPNTNW